MGRYRWPTIQAAILLMAVFQVANSIDSSLGELTFPKVDSAESKEAEFIQAAEIETRDERVGQTSTSIKKIHIGLVLSPENSESSSNQLELLIRAQLAIRNNPEQQQLLLQQLTNITTTTQVELVSTLLAPNAIEMSEIICKQLIGNEGGGVSAVIVDTDHRYLASIASISFTLGLYSIPVLGTTLRDSSLFNKNLHSSYVSLIPPSAHQADVWLGLMGELQFKQAFVLISSENRDLLSRLVDLIEQRRQPANDGAGGDASNDSDNNGNAGNGAVEFKIEAIIEYDAGAFADRETARQNLAERILKLLENSICRVFLVHTQVSDDVQLFVDLIKHLNMASEGFALVLSEDTVRVAKENRIRLPSGILTSRLSSLQQPVPPASAKNNKNNTSDSNDSVKQQQLAKASTEASSAYALDALELAIRSVAQISRHEAAFRDVPNSCQLRPSADWSTGIELYLAMLRQKFVGRTGLISFDENGDRLTANYDLLNLADDGGDHLGRQVLNPIGTFKNSLKLAEAEEAPDEWRPFASGGQHKHQATTTKLRVGAIQWPGGLKGQPISGVYVNKHLRVVTLQEKPFVWVVPRDLTSNGNFDCWASKEQGQRGDAGFSQTSQAGALLPCSRLNLNSGIEEKFCCKGYCIDLLDEISRQLNFTYDLYLAPNNLYGTLEFEPAELAGEMHALTAEQNQRQRQERRQQQQQQQHIIAPAGANYSSDFSKQNAGNDAIGSGGSGIGIGGNGIRGSSILGQLSATLMARIMGTGESASSAPIQSATQGDQLRQQKLAQLQPAASSSSPVASEAVASFSGASASAKPNATNTNFNEASHTAGSSGGASGSGSASNSGQVRAKWSGLMGELVSKRADMAFAPLTITAQRAQAIDFSKPFKFHGFSILLRRASKHTTLASFLQPFHNQLWVLVIGVATHVVALSLYLLDRYSTFGSFGIKRKLIPQTGQQSQQHNSGHAGDHPLHLSSSLWFSWSILLNSGVGEHTPKSLSGRVLGIFWSGFAMIVVASYTANLAAFLVLDLREETPTPSGIDDPSLRSGELALNFATVRNSAVDAYLQSQVEYINLYRKMEEFNFNSVDESILALRAGTIDALIWDSTRLEWEVATDEHCSLGIAGELFGSSGYGIGLQRDSHWTKNITTKLLELHESGYMVELDKKWIGSGGQRASSGTNGGGGGSDTASTGSLAGEAGQQQHDTRESVGSSSFSPPLSPAGGACERRNDDYPETLGIFNIAGVFILFAGGLLTSCVLILVEHLCNSTNNLGSHRSLRCHYRQQQQQQRQAPTTS